MCRIPRSINAVCRVMAIGFLLLAAGDGWADTNIPIAYTMVPASSTNVCVCYTRTPDVDENPIGRFYDDPMYLYLNPSKGGWAQLILIPSCAETPKKLVAGAVFIIATDCQPNTGDACAGRDNDQLSLRFKRTYGGGSDSSTCPQSLTDEIAELTVSLTLESGQKADEYYYNCTHDKQESLTLSDVLANAKSFSLRCPDMDKQRRPAITPFVLGLDFIQAIPP